MFSPLYSHFIFVLFCLIALLYFHLLYFILPLLFSNIKKCKIETHVDKSFLINPKEILKTAFRGGQCISLAIWRYAVRIPRSAANNFSIFSFNRNLWITFTPAEPRSQSITLRQNNQMDTRVSITHPRITRPRIAKLSVWLKREWSDRTSMHK